ncbi:MAG TPA: hypothetical protein VJ398_06200, partial [Acidimicrobiia bacterium]|nr:hypothetical protein [Acidimicrobiia bacterium]
MIDTLRDQTGGSLVDPVTLVGPNPSAVARHRLGGDLLVPPDGKVILPPGFDKRLRCYQDLVVVGELNEPVIGGA